MSGARRLCLLLVLVPFLAGCGGSPGLGRRFRAERALWHADREFKQLSIRPDLTSNTDRERVAERYQEIARRYGGPAAPGDTSLAAGERRTVAARALMDAAEVYLSFGRAGRADTLFARVEQEYADLPRMAGEAAWRRGAEAERMGRNQVAVRSYARAISAVPPHPGAPGVEGIVLGLPLRVARLRAASLADTSLAARKTVYEDSRAYYQRVADREPKSQAGLEAQSRLVDIDTDLQEWPGAISGLRRLLGEMRTSGDSLSGRDPGALRFAMAEAQRRMGARDSSAATLKRLVREEPRSPYAPRALLALSVLERNRGDDEAALQDLEKVTSDYPGAEDENAQARLWTADIYEKSDRWPKALEVYRSIPVEHPLTAAALAAPLRIVQHYSRVGDAEARGQALAEAEKAYKDFESRYPNRQLGLAAREQLVDVYLTEKRYPEAVQELVGIAADTRGQSRGVDAAFQAASLAVNQLGDTTRAIQILDQASGWYAPSAISNQLSGEAARLRRGGKP